jgi:hypothetical protein
MRNYEARLVPEPLTYERDQRLAEFGIALTNFRLRQSGGAGEKPEAVAGARVFVVPNPSGLNASFPGFRHKLVWFVALRKFVERQA